MSWFVRHFKPGSRPFEVWGGLRAFIQTFDDVRKDRKDFAIFREPNLKGEIVALYFSPTTEHLARPIDAVPCDSPTLERLWLLAGDEGDWDPIFR
jgi:hypothetical protein